MSDLSKVLLNEISGDLEEMFRKVVREEFQNISTQFKIQSQPDEIGGMELAKEITGYEAKTIYMLTSAREIPFMKKRGKLSFSRKSLTDWMSSGKQKTTEEVKAEANGR